MKLMRQSRTGYWFPWEAVAFRDYFPINGLKVENFDLTPSDYDVGDDQIVCPCGAELHRWPDDTNGLAALGAAIQVARDHLREAHGVTAS